MTLPPITFHPMTEPIETWTRMVIGLRGAPIQLRLDTGEELWVEVTGVRQDDMGTHELVYNVLAYPTLHVAHAEQARALHLLAAIVVT